MISGGGGGGSVAAALAFLTTPVKDRQSIYMYEDVYVIMPPLFIMHRFFIIFTHKVLHPVRPSVRLSRVSSFLETGKL